MTLLQETLDILKVNNKTIDDIKWIGFEEFKFDWDWFKGISNIDYDSGYGSHKVYSNLVIVGDDWWLSRGEYDGSEWWDFNKQPKKPTMDFNIDSLIIEDYKEDTIIKCFGSYENFKKLERKQKLQKIINKH